MRAWIAGLVCLAGCTLPARAGQGGRSEAGMFDRPAGASCTLGGQGVHAFVGARILPVVPAQVLEDGVLIVRDGRIESIGARGKIQIPAEAVLHDLRGKVIVPGLVDTHSHVGGGWGADGSGPIQPETRQLDAIDVRDEGLQRAQAGGLTTINIMSGSGHLMSGQTLYVKNRDANTIEELCYRWPDGSPMGGMKMANGTNSQKDPPFPGTRGKSASLVRERFVAAQDYRRKLEAAAGDPTKAPARDLGMEALLEVLDGKRIVHHHTHRHDDVMTVLRLQREFGFRVVLHHVSEAVRVADEIAAAGVGSSLILIDAPGGKLEAADFDPRGALELVQRGAPVAIHTDDWITDSRLFLRDAALAIRAGLDEGSALAALTIQGARMLDLQDRVGSLEPGKDADLVVLSGPPFSVWTEVLETWVGGERVFDASDPADHLRAVGGWGAGRPRAEAICCMEGGDR